MESTRPLRILFVEDNPPDAELAEATLAREGVSFTARRVDTKESLLRALSEFQPNLIISDYAMPDFDGMEALALSLANDPNIPFIILTGSMNEETAVACLREGAVDYVLKENLARLPHAVKEALAHRDARVAQAEAEDALRMSEARLRALIENGLDSISILAPDGTLLWESPAVVRNLDYAENQFVGRNIFELLHPDDLEWTRKRFEALLRTPKARDTGEFRLRRRSGEWRWIEAIVTNLLDDPSVGAIVINHRDITDRKQAEAALRESEARLRLALEAARMGTFDWDIPNNRITWSRGHEELWGFAPGEFAGTYEAFSARIHPEDRPLIDTEVQRCIASRESYAREYRVIWPDGSIHWIQGRGEFSFDENGRPLRMRGVVMETTERRQVEEALRESERLLSQAQRIARLGSWKVEIETGEVIWSEETYRVFGGSPETFERTLESFLNLIHPEDRTLLEEWTRACAAGEQPGPLVFRITLPDGGLRYLQGDGTLERDRAGKPVRMVGTAQDITERKLTENLIIESRNRLLGQQGTLAGLIRGAAFSGPEVDATIQRLLEAAARQQRVERVSLWRFARDGAAIRCVDLYESGANRHSSGMEIERTLYPAYFNALLSEEAIVADDAHAHPHTREFSETYLKPLGITSMLDIPVFVQGKFDGVLCHERVGSPISWSPEQRLFATSIANLVSLALEQAERNRVEEEHNKLQDQLLQAQKMDAIGRLAGGVAHVFNNMLQAILGHVDIASRAGSPESPVQEDLLAIRQAAMRSADLTRQLLAFARKQTIEPKILDLNDTVSGMLRMLQRLIGEDIQLIWTPGHRLWRVRIDPSQVNQILANLTVNARDAISGVGQVTINTSNATLDEAYCEEYVGCVPGEYVRLSVSDNGRGMSKEIVEQIFEPFFTTKGVGEGTGLGLATVYGIVKQNEGFIQVQSELGQGASFQIFFPRCGSDLADQTLETETEPPRGGTETILLVEDEPAILLIGRRILEELGYTVLPASRPKDALELAASHPGEIHLLITDVVMPEMDGRELAGRLHSIKPSMKLLFMSGYTPNVIAHRGVLEAGVRFIAKPFNLQEFGRKVRQVLDS